MQKILVNLIETLHETNINFIIRICKVAKILEANFDNKVP